MMSLWPFFFLLRQVTNAVVLKAFPEYHRIHDEVHVHITFVPIVDKLRDLREVCLGGMVQVLKRGGGAIEGKWERKGGRATDGEKE